VIISTFGRAVKEKVRLWQICDFRRSKWDRNADRHDVGYAIEGGNYP
jgi:hypothetical protein